jgi:hypothetical protein
MSKALKLRELAAAGEPAGEPDEAGRRPDRPTIPDRVYHLLPPKLADACRRFEKWTERGVYLTALLVCLSAAQPHVRFRYGRRYHSPHLFAFIVAAAAMGKGVLELARAWIEPVDDALTAASAEARARWAQDKEERERMARTKDGRDALRLLNATDPLGPEPAARYLLMGEDTTSAGLIDALHANPETVALITTEAGSVTEANGREFGRFDHLFRKAFHNERTAENRRGGGRLVIAAARLALLLSGTRDQVARFVDRVENGLFSRFIFYVLDGALAYESQQDTSRDETFDRMTAVRAADTKRLYDALAGRPVDAEGRTTPLYVDLPRPAWERMDAAFGGLFARLFAGGGADPALAANVKRGPVICYRLAVVLAVWRAYEEGVDLRAAPSLTIGDDDAEAALLLALVYVENALLQAADLSRRFAVKGALDLGGDDRMTARDRAFLDALPASFDRAGMGRAAAVAGISQATAYRRMDAWTDAGLILKDGQGVYRKAEKTENAAKAEKTAPVDAEMGFSHGSQDSQFSQGDGTPADAALSRWPCRSPWATA